MSKIITREQFENKIHTIKPYGHGGYILTPKKLVGLRARVVIIGGTKNDEKERSVPLRKPVRP